MRAKLTFINVIAGLIATLERVAAGTSALTTLTIALGVIAKQVAGAVSNVAVVVFVACGKARQRLVTGTSIVCPLLRLLCLAKWSLFIVARV